MKLLAFGEVLFDVYPSGAKIGGAPLNFASHFSKLGGESFIYSAYGNDALGRTLCDHAESVGISRRYLIKTDHPTGVCRVSYEGTEPRYELVRDTAYDNIPLDESVLREDFGLFYYGTLARRSPVSDACAARLIRDIRAEKKFCDLNLRQNYYSEKLISECIAGCDILKLNREEYKLCSQMFFGKALPFREFSERLCEKFHVELVIITLDCEGSFVYDVKENREYRRGIEKSDFRSAVGAGDSFSACFLYSLFSGIGIEESLYLASVLAAYVVSFEEAVPEYSEELKKKLSAPAHN